MERKQSVRKYLVVTVLALVILVQALAFCFVILSPPVYGDTYVAALSDKCRILREGEKPRIILIGGSGTAFDYRRDLLQEEFPDYSVVNFGLYGGIGTTVMMDLAEDQLREGDLVILSPELTRETLSDWTDPIYVWQGLEEAPGELLHLSCQHRETLLDALPAYALQKGKTLLGGSYPEGNGIYRRTAFDRAGDLTLEERESNRMLLGYDPNQALSLEILPEENFLTELSDFSRRAEEAGAQVFFRFCPMNRAAFAQEPDPDALADYQEKLEALLPCAYLGSMEDSLYEKEWFYDSNFHLNASGTLPATALLPLDLKEEMGMDPVLSDAFPEMPDKPALVETGGASEESEWTSCFLYELSEDGTYYRITGLTPEGEASELLELPESYEGLPVRTFGRGVFAGNNTLEELVIPETVSLVEDGSFAGCKKLETITFRHREPGDCSVGQGLLEGSRAQICVPEDSLGRYLVDYFWSAYAGSIRAELAAEEPHGQEAEEGTRTASETFAPQWSEAVDENTLIPMGTVYYDGNGGKLRYEDGKALKRSLDHSHNRINSLSGTGYFVREGWCLTGWNTKADGTGTRIGLGSRMDRDLTRHPLFAVWEKENPETDFDTLVREGEVWIIGYHGGEVCVIPAAIGGLPVTGIAEGAFGEGELDRLVISPGIRTLEEGALAGGKIRELVLYDSVTEISDGSFGGTFPETLYLNAVRSPVYSGSYYDTFSDKYDRLLSLRDEKKIVLASGSSGRYGYDSTLIRQTFPDYQVVNMGVYAYSNAYPQLMLILGLMGEGDILLSAPEFDAAEEQFCLRRSFDHHTWAMMESDYDMITGLNLREFESVFDSFSEYQQIRSSMEGKNYSISPNNYDDDGNYYVFSTYNEYGDFVLPRENAERDERHRSNIADYTLGHFPEELVESLNRVYELFLGKGIRVYFSYTPRNRSSLTEESTVEARAELDTYLRARLSVPVISDMEESLYSGIYFWKIDSHLSSEGQKLRTEQIIRDLLPMTTENEPVTPDLLTKDRNVLE